MRFPDESLYTPIYIKTSGDMDWPEDEVFYVLSSSGLYLGRNYLFYKSVVPARSWPAELAGQGTVLEPRYPKVSQSLMEWAVGFFAEVGRTYGAEASVVLVWDERLKRVRLFVPEQRCTVYRGWKGQVYPVGVHYNLPVQIPEGWVIFGDIHSHVDGAAFASHTDKQDESHRPGLHIVVGRIWDEPPEFHVEAIVDGVRFPLDLDQAVEGYERRRNKISGRWLDKVEIESYENYWDYWASSPSPHKNWYTGKKKQNAGGSKDATTGGTTWSKGDGKG